MHLKNVLKQQDFARMRSNVIIMNVMKQDHYILVTKRIQAISRNIVHAIRLKKPKFK